MAARRSSGSIPMPRRYSWPAAALSRSSAPCAFRSSIIPPWPNARPPAWPSSRSIIPMRRQSTAARDRHRAAVDCRRIGMIDLELGHAGGLAFGQGGIIEERKAHGALDLESAAAGQEYRRGMGIDPLDRRAAMGCGVAKKIDHRLLRGSGRAHPSSSGWRYYRPDQYRRTDPNQCTPWPDAVII